MNLRELQPYVIGWIRDYLSQALAGALTLLHLIVTDLTVIGQVIGSLKVTGDLYTVPWSDFSALSTITGWSSFTYKKLWYKKVGRLVFVLFYISGTSNSPNTSFTLPFTAAHWDWSETIKAQDNGGWQVSPMYNLPEHSATLSCYTSPSAGGWTASGFKYVQGHFWYEAE